eukprot:scaffold3241_cov125-Cylindrotheca_fusiformis.AAC.8
MAASLELPSLQEFFWKWPTLKDSKGSSEYGTQGCGQSSCCKELPGQFMSFQFPPNLPAAPFNMLAAMFSKIEMLTSEVSLNSENYATIITSDYVLMEISYWSSVTSDN